MTIVKDAYDELKKAYEGKSATEFYALLNSLTSIFFDDRKSSIEEHIIHYEHTWNSFVGVISRADLLARDDDGFCEGLQKFVKSDKAKAEFLLKSLLAFYANTVENIRAKDCGYDDAARKLKEYIPMRQKSKKGTKTDEGTLENPVILKTDKKRDTSKQCDYCKTNGWKGIGHVESECFTKKREQKFAKKPKANEDMEDNEDEEICVGAIKSD
jgi:hypothetical protein